MKYNHCNEKGMRLESATVPAAVMPDRSNDDGFVKYLPLSRFIRMGRLHETGISQKTCQIIPDVQSFREEKRRIKF
jgi:hypothetical protein